MRACTECGSTPRQPVMLPHGPICARCRRWRHYHHQRCPGCGQTRPLAWRDQAGRTVCAGCAGEKSIFACPKCGSEAHPYAVAGCARCVFAGQLSALLADPATGEVHARLAPVFTALVDGTRPQSTLYWLARPPGHGPRLLAQMARGQAEISHAAFEALPADKARTHLRHLLVTAGVLPAYHAGLERVTGWLEEILAGLPAGHAGVIARFARWQVLRRLRRHAQAGTLTQGTISAARANIMVAIRFLTWLDAHGMSITTLTQDGFDRYAASHPARAGMLAPFLRWAARTGLAPRLDVPVRQPPPPQVTLSDTGRWAQAETLLHDDGIGLNTRIAGLFTLLFAQPLARICQMRAGQVTCHPGGTVTVTFDAAPVELPGPLDQLVLAQLARSGPAARGSDGGRWLFPGGVPGRHLTTGAIRTQLTRRGIHPAQSRKAALFQLAAEIPAPVLAELLGLGTNTATRWAALAARDWSCYTALRREASSQPQQARRDADA